MYTYVKKALYFLALTLLVLCLGGCSLQFGDGLLLLPKVPAEYVQLQQQLDTALADMQAAQASAATAAELRRQLIRRDLPSYIDTDALYALAQSVLDLCREGLQERGEGEEQYLEPLYDRVRRRTNPAKEMLNRLQNGESMAKLIADYGSLQ